MMRYKSVFIFISVFIFALTSCKALEESEPEVSAEPSQKSDQPNAEVVSEKSQEGNGEGDAKTVNRNTVDDVNKTNVTNTNKTIVVSCILNQTDSGSAVEVWPLSFAPWKTRPLLGSLFQIVNATRLPQILQLEQNVTKRGAPGKCVAVLFYSPSCPFSCMAAPHFNALPRFFPDIKMIAFDAVQYRGFNAQYGIVGTPTLMLFHSGRPAFKFNGTGEYGLSVFANFITKHTGLKPVGKLMVTSADFGGPISSVPVKETDYYLILSWMVIAARVLYSLYYSTWGRSLVDATLNAWREAEAQHHHAD